MTTPSAPTNLQASFNDAANPINMTLTWDAAANIGTGSTAKYTITTSYTQNTNVYTATYIVSGTGTTGAPATMKLIPAATNTIASGGWYPNRTYSITIKAARGALSSAASSAITVTTPSPNLPGPATSFTVEQMVNSGIPSIKVAWIYGSNGGDARATWPLTITSSSGGSVPLQSLSTTTGQRTIYFPIAHTQPSSPALPINVIAGQSYTFTVTGRNSAGDSTNNPSATIVPVDNAPTAPTSVSATGAALGSATVSWTAPSNADQYSPVASYTVTPSSGTPVTVDGTQTSALVTGLSSGSAYTFTVRATNALGYATSDASSSITLPAPPTNVTVTPGIQSAIVRWTLSTTTAIRYIVTAMSAGGGGSGGMMGVGGSIAASVAVGGSATSATITGLTAGSTYTFIVATETAVGTAPAAASSSYTIIGTQTITFPAISAVLVPSGTSVNGYSVSYTPPTSSSGLTVSLTASGALQLSGSTLTATGVGIGILTATQAGNGTYLPVTVIQSIKVLSAPPAAASTAIGSGTTGSALTNSMSTFISNVKTASSSANKGADILSDIGAAVQNAIAANAASGSSSAPTAARVKTSVNTAVHTALAANPPQDVLDLYKTITGLSSATSIPASAPVPVSIPAASNASFAATNSDTVSPSWDTSKGIVRLLFKWDLEGGSSTQYVSTYSIPEYIAGLIRGATSYVSFSIPATDGANTYELTLSYEGESVTMTYNGTNISDGTTTYGLVGNAEGLQSYILIGSLSYSFYSFGSSTGGPAPPPGGQTVTATKGTLSATLTWDAFTTTPNSDTDSNPVTGYTIRTYTVSGGNKTLVSTASKTTGQVSVSGSTVTLTNPITGLSASNTYIFSVTATDSNSKTSDEYDSNSITPDGAAAITGDPYVTTVAGAVYKLPTMNAPIRFYQGQVNGKTLTINVTLKTIENVDMFDSNFKSYLELKDSIPVQHRKRIGNNLLKKETLSFFERVYVEYGDSTLQVNLWNHKFEVEARQGPLNAHAVDGTELLGNYSHAYKDYKNSTICFRFGEAKLYMSVYKAPMVRNGLYLEAPAMADGNGVVVHTLSRADMTIDSLTTTASVPKRNSASTKTINEIFIDHKGTRTRTIGVQ